MPIRAAGLTILLVAAAVLVPFLLRYPPLSLEAELARFSIVLPLAVLVGYLMRESGRHRRAADRARDLGAHLRHLVAFMHPLPPMEQHRYRAELGRRAWPSSDPPAAPDTASSVGEELPKLTELVRGRNGAPKE